MGMLCVDPGKHWSGCARFIGGRLASAWLHDTAGPPAVRRGGPLAIVEIPQVYRNRPVRTADLIDLAAAAGRVAANHEAQYRRPAQWKGQLRKDIQHARMRKVLDAGELAIVDAITCAPSLRHNVYDAICIGLSHLGRFRA